MTDIPIISSDFYTGSRGSDFVDLISGLLSRGKLKPKYISLLTNEESMKAYSTAFTAYSFDPINNYERFEQLGDVTANKFIVWYAYKRFPQLDCTEGVKVVARLRINYGATKIFSSIGEELGFWPFISAEINGTDHNKKYRNRHMKQLLEDVFEAFIGCTEWLLDKAFRTGVGYAIVYDILLDIFDNRHMSIAYEDLYDSKTRLKETFDMKKGTIGTWAYTEEKKCSDPESICTHEIKKSMCAECIKINALNVSRVYQIPEGVSNEKYNKGWILIGTGIASKKIDAEQIAAEEGIVFLKKKGIYKHPPSIYAFFCA